VGFLTPHYTPETPYRAVAGGETDVVGSFTCVGGPSVFYGGVSLRFRAPDFEPARTSCWRRVWTGRARPRGSSAAT
jgi:hypothetical protein